MAKENLADFEELPESDSDAEPVELDPLDAQDSKPEPLRMDGSVVLVTGCTGFVGSHLVRCLLNAGAAVRGTTTDLSSEYATELKSLFSSEVSSGQFVMLQANLLKSDGWADALNGCDYAILAASPVPLDAKDDTAALVVGPAYEGTKIVLRACAATKTVKRVVLISCIGAIIGGQPVSDGKLFTEDIWAKRVGVDLHQKAKVQQEQIAAKLMQALTKDHQFELVTLCLAHPTGPLLMKRRNLSESFFVTPIMSGRECCRQFLPIVDVRDAAKITLSALLKDGLNGQRICVFTNNICQVELAKHLEKHFPDYRINTNKGDRSDWLAKYFIRPGVQIFFSREKMSQLLEIDSEDLIHPMTSLTDMAYSLVEKAIVQLPKPPPTWDDFFGPKKQMQQNLVTETSNASTDNQ